MSVTHGSNLVEPVNKKKYLSRYSTTFLVLKMILFSSEEHENWL